MSQSATLLSPLGCVAESTSLYRKLCDALWRAAYAIRGFACHRQQARTLRISAGSIARAACIAEAITARFRHCSTERRHA